MAVVAVVSVFVLLLLAVTLLVAGEVGRRRPQIAPGALALLVRLLLPPRRVLPPIDCREFVLAGGTFSKPLLMPTLHKHSATDVASRRAADDEEKVAEASSPLLFLPLPLLFPPVIFPDTCVRRARAAATRSRCRVLALRRERPIFPVTAASDEELVGRRARMIP